MRIVIPLHRPEIGQRELEAVRRVFDSGWLGMGSATREFEERLREVLGVKHVVAVNTGTSALHLAIEALELQPGDEVLVPSLTFVGSVQAILAARARPVFCDVSPETLQIDLADALRRVTARTRAIMPVHYGGAACEMDELLPAARERNLRVVEDAAHAFGSAYKGRKVGTLGDVTCFSFDPVKNITCGEGGAVATDSDDLARRVRLKRMLGITPDAWSRRDEKQPWFYSVVTPGYRYHLSNLNAAIGLQQLQRLEAFKARKQAIVRAYDDVFRSLSGLKLIVRNGSETCPFLYVVRVLGSRRDALIAHLRERGIGTGVHYIPNHLQPLFAELRVSLPVTEQVFPELLTLPLYAGMSDEDVQAVTAAVQSFFSNSG